MPKKLLFNFNREAIQNYTYVKYAGTIITATNTLEKPIKSAILTGSTKYRDIDTGEILETFEEGRNLELVSVKTPVLTTTGKNLFDGNLINGYYEDGTLNKIIGDNTNLYKTIKLNLKKGTYTFSFEESVRFIRQLKDGVYNNLGGDFTKFTTTLNTDGIYVLSFRKTDNTDFDLSKIQIEEGSVATAYEPYKTNILTVNEDIELRAIGDIRDELDCLTGEYVQRLGERTFVGNDDENWTLRNTFKNTILFANDNLGLNGFTDYALSNTKMICDKFICGAYENQDIEFVCMRFTGQGVMIGISSSKLATQNVVGFKQWLTQNPITIQYHLAAESVKTVDLSMLDQNENKVSSISSFNDTTHIMASSETIPPIFEGYLATKEG